MKDEVIKISVSDIFLDESIYPRENMDHKRIGIFVENLRDGFEFEPIHIQAFENLELSESCSTVKEKSKYRILDGAHRWSAYKKTGQTRIPAIVKTLNKIDPLLYAAKLAIGPKQLTEVETRNTARRAFQSNSRLTSSEIGRAIGRSRQAVDLYIADLRATTLLALDLKIFRLNQLGIPQDRIAKRLGINRRTLAHHLAKMPGLAKWPNSDLSKGFTVPQVANKHDWPESMVWSQALQGKDDLTRFKALNWGIRTWDLWNFNDCDKRFGDDWPGRIPAQLIAHILYFFSKQDDLIFDPPYFDKKADEYSEQSISGLSRKDYLSFLERFFRFLKKISKKTTRLAFINSDWRDFQNCPAGKEEPGQAILVVDYYEILKKTGWTLTHIIQAPLSSERFNAGVVSAMQKKKILGVVSRYVMILRLSVLCVLLLFFQPQK